MPSAKRNDPCPCGSGKKFRKCHGVAKKPSGVPAWLFFALLALLAAAALYYKNSGNAASNSLAPLPSSSAASPVSGAAGVPLVSDPLARFENLPGFPLSDVTQSQKKRFLDRVNSENCTCGCTGDTVAKCVVQDPNCQIAPAMANRILAEVKVTEK